MTPDRMEGARRRYRLLLRAYPAEHRERYGAEMEDAFVALLRRDDQRRGAWGRAACWVGATLDVAARSIALRVDRARTNQGRREARDMMGSLGSDIHFAIRSLRRRPVFTLTAVLTLALGIGANASVFTVTNTFLFTALPYERPDELAYVWAENPELGWENTDVNAADAWDFRERVRAFEDLAVYGQENFNMTGDGPPELVTGIRITPNMLGLLGRAPLLGRDFTDDELGEGRDDVVVLTHGFWERRFGADPDVLGRTLTLDGLQKTVVGVMPADFLFLDERADLFVPLGRHPSRATRGDHNAEAVVRLADGATLAQAREELVDVARQLEVEHPEANDGWTAILRPARDELLGDIAKQASVVLMVAVGFVLLMACVNVANLLMARGGARRQELAVRAALGAGRARVLRQLLTESMVLAAVGGALGILMAQWGYRGIVAALPSTVPPVFRFGMDGTVLAYTVAITVGSALVFGLVPALRTTAGPMGELRDGGRGGSGRGASRFGSVLVVVQTALAVVLLVGGGLLMKSIAGMRTQDFGFDPENVLTVRIAPPGTAYEGSEELRAFWDAVEARVGQVAGVEAVGSTQSHPLMGSNWGGSVRTAGPDGAPSQERRVRLTYASPGLFEALDFEVVRGRPLGVEDARDAPPVVVVNEAFVRRYLGEGVDPLSAYLVGEEADTPDGAGTPDRPIVGVIRDVVERGVDDPPEPSMYVALDQAVVRSRSLVVETAGPPRDFVDAVQAAVWSVDPDLPVFSVETMEELIERRVGGFAVIGYLMGTFALMSLVLGAVGIYGVTSYSAQQRTAEIGVRVAMGAERGDVVRMVVREGAKRAAIGLALGLGAAFALGGALSSILVGVSPTDPATFGAVVAVLGGVSLLGLWLPARKAAGVDPVRALASE